MFSIKRSKKLKTVIIGAFVAISGVCYSFFMPKEEANVEITRGETGLSAGSYTSTPVPTPTEKPAEGTVVNGGTGENRGEQGNGNANGQNDAGSTNNQEGNNSTNGTNGQSGNNGTNGSNGNDVTNGQSGNNGTNGSNDNGSTNDQEGKNNGTTGQNGNSSSDTKNSKVNINTASSDELTTLPGIGESRAAWIIEYRNKNGPFKRIEDIMQVKGIKEGIFSKIKDRISVE